MKSILLIIDGDTATTSPKHRWLLGMSLALVVCVSSCCAIPTPELDSGRARANINDKTPQQFEFGKTTRADVISALGEPDAVSPDELMLAYRSEKIRGYFYIVYGRDIGTIYKDLYLVAVFDAHGVLQKLEPSSSWLSPADPNKILPAATTTNENSAVRGPVFWLKGVDGYKSPGSIQMIGVRGQLLLTDTELQFVVDADKGQFANACPTGLLLILPFDAITEVRVDDTTLSRRLVVRTRAGEVHSFAIFKGLWLNKEALQLQSITDLLQSKIKR
jgi:hypothetical protein